MPRLGPGQKTRYGNASNSIVASARDEANMSYQSSILPRSRLSMDMVKPQGTVTSMSKRAAAGGAAPAGPFDYPMPGGKLSIGLPPMKHEAVAGAAIGGSTGSAKKISAM